MMDSDLLMILTVISECNDDDDDHKDDDYEKRGLSRKQFLAVFFSLCTTVLFLALAGLSRDKR